MCDNKSNKLKTGIPIIITAEEYDRLYELMNSLRIISKANTKTIKINSELQKLYSDGFDAMNTLFEGIGCKFCSEYETCFDRLEALKEEVDGLLDTENKKNERKYKERKQVILKHRVFLNPDLLQTLSRSVAQYLIGDQKEPAQISVRGGELFGVIPPHNYCMVSVFAKKNRKGVPVFGIDLQNDDYKPISRAVNYFPLYIDAWFDFSRRVQALNLKIKGRLK